MSFLLQKFSKKRLKIKSVILFGAGWHTLQLYDLVNFSMHVKYYFDSDKRKQGTHFLNKLVLDPTQILKSDIEVVIISSGDYQDEMYESIKKFEKK